VAAFSTVPSSLHDRFENRERLSSLTITADGPDRVDEMITCVFSFASEPGVARSAGARYERTLAPAAQAGLDMPCM
jgi:urocanate hydratase